MKPNRLLTCGLVAATLIVILAIGIILAITRPARVVRAELARIKAEGAPLTMRDLDGAAIPDTQNGALVYQKAFALMSGDKAKKDLELIADACSPKHQSKTDAEWKDLSRTIAKYEAIFPLVEEASSKPDCRFPIGWQKSGALNASFPHIGPLRDISRILRAKAMLCIHENKAADAAKCVDLGYAVSNATTYHPTLIAFIVRCVQIHQASNALLDLLESKQLSPQDARRIMDRLARIELSSSLKDALQDERAAGIWLFDRMREDPASIAASIGSSGTGKTHGTGPLVHLWLDLDEGYYLRKMREYIDCSDQHYRVSATAPKQVDLSDMPKYAMLSAIVFPVLGGSLRHRDEAQAEISGGRVALALSLHHSEHKAYPAGLNELAGFLGGNLPIDPFSGKSFVYKNTGSGYLLYSIGPDLKDNRGAEPPPGKRVSTGGDIVWRVN